MAKIQYQNKETLNEQPSVAAINKVTDDDMNEIKQVVNTNDDNVGDLSNLNTTDKTSVVNAINELVAETGTSGIWNYIKYSNGIAICYGIYSWNITEWTSWGNVYVSGDYQNTSYPFTFTETPMTFLTGANSGSNNTTGIGQSAGLNSTTTTPGFRFQRPTNGSAVTGAKMSILAIGKWK